MVNRHDILRTALVWEGLIEPVQVVLRQAPLPIEEVVLDPAAGDAGQQLYTRFDPRRVRIDLRQAPMLRVCIAFDAAQNRWLMLTRWHHIIGDHTTNDVIQEEIQAHLLGRAELLTTSVPYRNVVAQSRPRHGARKHTKRSFGRCLETWMSLQRPSACWTCRVTAAELRKRG